MKTVPLEFIRAQRPLISCLRFFGFFSYDIEAAQLNNSFKLHAYCILVNIIFMVVFIANGLISVESFAVYLNDKGKVTPMCLVFEIVLVQINAIGIFYTVFFTRNKQIEILGSLDKLEHKLKGYPFTGEIINKFHRSLKLRSWIVVIGTIMFLVSLQIIFSMILSFDEGILQVANVLIFSSYFIFVIGFILQIAMTIAKLIEVINLNLKSFVSNQDFHLKEVCSILELHNQLTVMIQKFNCTFGIILFGSYVWFSGTLSIEAYFAYITIYTKLVQKSSSFIIYSVMNIIWLSPFFLILQLLGYESSKIQEIVSETRRIMNICNLNGLLGDVGRRYLINQLNADYRLTTNGMFVVDFSIIFKVSIVFHAIFQWF